MDDSICATNLQIKNCGELNSMGIVLDPFARTWSLHYNLIRGIYVSLVNDFAEERNCKWKFGRFTGRDLSNNELIGIGSKVFPSELNISDRISDFDSSSVQVKLSLVRLLEAGCEMWVIKVQLDIAEK